MDPRLKILLDAKPDYEENSYAIFLKYIEIAKLFSNVADETYELIDMLSMHSPGLNDDAFIEQKIDAFLKAFLKAGNVLGSVPS